MLSEPPAETTPQISSGVPFVAVVDTARCVTSLPASVLQRLHLLHLRQDIAPVAAHRGDGGEGLEALPVGLDRGAGCRVSVGRIRLRILGHGVFSLWWRRSASRAFFVRV